MIIQNQTSVKETQTFPTCTQIRKSLFSANYSAEIRSTNKRTYVAQDNVASLGVAYGQEFESQRVTFIPVLPGTTKEQVNEELAKFPKAKIVRILALEPILTQNQVVGVERHGQEVYEKIKNRQIVRDQDGNPVLYNNQIQYARNILILNPEDLKVVNKETGEVMNFEGYTLDLRGATNLTVQIGHNDKPSTNGVAHSDTDLY